MHSDTTNTKLNDTFNLPIKHLISQSQVSRLIAPHATTGQSD